MLNLAACGDSSPPPKTFTTINELDTSSLNLKGKLTLYTGKDGRNFLLEQTQDYVSGPFFQDGKPLEMATQFLTNIKSIAYRARSDSNMPFGRGLVRLASDLMRDKGPPYVRQSDIDALVKIGETYCRSGALPEGYSISDSIKTMALPDTPNTARFIIKRRLEPAESSTPPTAPTPDP
jgi:hypothetical protein